jgi:hypothetical protein
MRKSVGGEWERKIDWKVVNNEGREVSEGKGLGEIGKEKLIGKA